MKDFHYPCYNKNEILLYIKFMKNLKASYQNDYQ